MSFVSRRIIVFVLVALMLVALAAVSVSALTQSNVFIKPVQAQYDHRDNGRGNGQEANPAPPGNSGGSRGHGNQPEVHPQPQGPK